MGEKLGFTDSDWRRLKIYSSNWIPTYLWGIKYRYFGSKKLLTPQCGRWFFDFRRVWHIEVSCKARSRKLRNCLPYGRIVCFAVPSLTVCSPDTLHLPAEKLVLRSVHMPYKDQREAHIATRLAKYQLFPFHGLESIIGSKIEGLPHPLSCFWYTWNSCYSENDSPTCSVVVWFNDLHLFQAMENCL